MAGAPVHAHSGWIVHDTGAFPDGTKFESPSAFREALIQRKDAFVRTLIEKLMTYALGRGIDYRDMPAVRGVAREAASSDYRWSSLILAIVNSTPFQMRLVES